APPAAVTFCRLASGHCECGYRQLRTSASRMNSATLAIFVVIHSAGDPQGTRAPRPPIVALLVIEDRPRVRQLGQGGQMLETIDCRRGRVLREHGGVQPAR